MSVLTRTLARTTQNRFVQGLLQRNVLLSQYLMGVGSGGGVNSSGEHAIFEYLRRKVDGPYCVFDVGANKGQFLQLALKGLQGTEYTIHCFEPGHETFTYLEQAASGRPDVHLNNFGLGKERGEATLHYDEAGSGLASLTKRRLDHLNIAFEQAETVSMTTIDDYCAARDIARIHLLKIDIEGHELDALAGASRMLAAQAIDIVTFEFGGCNIDTRTYFQDFWYLFSQSNFDLFRITPLGYFHPLEAYSELHEQFRTTNFMAVTRR